ncbi:hypothetical protein C0992_001195, partial [Termitomyces sp. T32_za158]
LTMERANLGISEGIKSSSETRFSTSYLQAKAIQLCMPAIHMCMSKKTLLFDTKATQKLRPYLDAAEPAHYNFMSELASFIQLLAPGANAILTLEGQAINCADVFYAWVCIAWHLEKVLGNPRCGLIERRSKIMEIYNHRFDQMMTESSYEIFLLSYWLHPLFRHNGGIQLAMPALQGGKTLNKENHPAIYKRFLRAALYILKGEQQRLNAGGKEECAALVNELLRWAYNQEPFRTYSWDIDTSPLSYWKGLKRDSNASQLAYSAPSLMDLLNDDDITPLDTNIERLEAEWFEAVDPYDLGETKRMDAAKPDEAQIVRCNNRWKIADLVKLDSPSLGALIARLSGNTAVHIQVGTLTAAESASSGGPTGRPDDWDMEDYVA